MTLHCDLDAKLLALLFLQKKMKRNEFEITQTETPKKAKTSDENMLAKEATSKIDSWAVELVKKNHITDFTVAGIGKYQDFVAKHGRGGSKQLTYGPDNKVPGLGIQIREFTKDEYCAVANCDVFERKDKDGKLEQVRIVFRGEKKAEENEEFIGKANMDTGQLLITDPCYVLPVNPLL